MSNKDTSVPAFPVASEIAFQRGEPCFGMTLRDWFAGQALAGLLASTDVYCSTARLAYEYADAMLKAREDTP